MLVPFGVWGGMWNSVVSAPDHCLLVYFSHLTHAQGRRQLLKSDPAMGRRKHSLSAEGTRRGEHEREGVSPSRRISPEKRLGSERLYMNIYCKLSARFMN